MATRYEYNVSFNNKVTVYSSRWQGQTFTPSIAHKITSVKLRLCRVGSPWTTMVSIRATDASGHPTGPDLCSASFDGNTLITYKASGHQCAWKEISLGAGADLSADTKYAIVLRAEAGNVDNYVYWMCSDSGACDGGCRETSSNAGSSWTSYAWCFTFEDWGEPAPIAPTVSTVAATLVEETTANPRGDVTDTGGENPTRYIDYGTSSGSYPNSKNCGVGGVGVYNSNLTSLSPGTKYYYRARAVNSAGTGLGSELNFTTKPNPPTNLSAIAVSSSQINLTWTKGSGAEKTYIRGKKGSYPTDRSDGYEVYNGTGTSCSDTALDKESAYYYRAWSYKTGSPNSGYSDDYAQASATTLAEIPTVTAQPATSIEVTTARLNGEVTDDGGESPTVHIYWGTSDGETTPGNWDHDEDLGVKAVGTFYKDISSLTRGTKYYYRCYVENSAGSTWSNAIEFTTLLEKPVAAANAATNVGVSAATLNGTVTDDGGGSCQYRFRYKKAGGDYAYTAWTGAKTTGETFSEGISGLDASSTYYFNAQVKNSQFESDWSAEQTFNTGAVVVAPTGTTDPATLVADIEATLNGTVTSDGGEACEVRFQYGLTAAYGTNTAWQPGKLTSNTFSQRIYGLAPNTTYHFRAQIKNSAGTANGADRTFTTEYLPTPFLRRVLRDVFGGGSDISAANPLQVYDPKVASQTAYSEDSASGTTTNTWADALDLDTRGMKKGAIVVKNTDGANSLDYKVLERAANYAAGTDEELQASYTLAAGEKAKVNLNNAHSRIKVQVESTLVDTPATYTIEYLINR